MFPLLIVVFLSLLTCYGHSRCLLAPDLMVVGSATNAQAAACINVPSEGAGDVADSRLYGLPLDAASNSPRLAAWLKS